MGVHGCCPAVRARGGPRGLQRWACMDVVQPSPRAEGRGPGIPTPRRLAVNHFLLGLASDARRPCLSQGGLSRGDCGTPFRPTRLSSRTAEFGPGAGLGPFRPLPLSPPFRHFGRPEFRPGRRGPGGRSDARTWPIRELGGVAGDPLHWPLPQSQNCRCDRRAATESGSA